MIEARRAYWAIKRPNWLNEPVARVEGALKFIGEKTLEMVQNAKGQWMEVKSPTFYDALEYAKRGNGAGVQAVALRVLAHGK